jgi:hypothetical protein
MVTTSVAYGPSAQSEVATPSPSWEEECYQAGCALARELAQQKLQALEEYLFQCRPPTWGVKGFRERTLMTRFGEVRLSRRLYCDPQGRYHFLLDEHLGWEKAQVATPGLKEAVGALASQVPFRQAAATLDKLTAGVLAPATIHRLVGRVTQGVLAEEEMAWRDCFEEGRGLPPGAQGVPVLFMEADGVWVHLQREPQKHYEVKSSVAYEGWQRPPQGEERYTLVGKRHYSQGNEAIPFWEGASLEFDRQGDLSQVKLVVLGGDGASWIDQGLEYFPGAVRQRDGFHLARWCRWAVGWELGPQIYQAIREGRGQEAAAKLAETPVLPGSKAQQAAKVVAQQLEVGVDWRCWVPQVPEGARGLGTMESQQDKGIANRMKKRGMSWRIPGAQRMAKLIQVVCNGEPAQWCWPRPEGQQVRTELKGNYRHPSRPTYGGWLQVGMPALWGPHASHPWAQALRALAYPSYRLN